MQKISINASLSKTTPQQPSNSFHRAFGTFSIRSPLHRSTAMQSAVQPLRVWYLGDSVLDITMHSAPVPLSMPIIMPTMWFQTDEMEKGRKAEQRHHEEAVRLLYSGHPELASRMLEDLRTSLQDRLQMVLYTEADYRFLRGEYQAALDILNHRQVLAPCDDVPDYKVHWMAGLCLANLGRLPEAILQLQLARQCATCERAEACISVLLVRLKKQMGMVQGEIHFEEEEGINSDAEN